MNRTIFILSILTFGVIGIHNSIIAQEPPYPDIEEPPLPVEEDPIYDFVEVEPQFPGGMDSLMNYIILNTEFPGSYEGQGNVYVQFVIEKSGEITNIKVVKGVNDAYDKEAIKVIESMPNWSPGEINGKAVRCRYTLPIRFTIH